MLAKTQKSNPLKVQIVIARSLVVAMAKASDAAIHPPLLQFLDCFAEVYALGYLQCTRRKR